ncbi:MULTISPECIES: sensor domain-containing diguanylate cyclase [unclassified Sulfuricurvum]|uniref:sensor domain-containing diguanylate cyclase n=1 Tax=unclassified Sulfuricurvum TaxID=2632390 RepID=UPI00029999A9|nr:MULTISPECIES: sensor domain-containing diguanylate cyclase [unclassified Sulfuricurvum]OHD80363.1 MAG: hypothetical protein A3D90_11265 [Sulfuricurvum sp. RIFCSPHIGHO2_02_FULL_43_9]OHD86669.1 MAG: hypothetical protein A3I60_01170 [Sulfuricurvum sp. RIFCSPLOWO2_02_FULL_43_45]AFV96761.1 hypothetical protein B649_02235 [Candidatus Sulfuricurvum sp. RIFRC-1]OHD90320.1 MAG: hypothetical protein A3G19_11465 [Sulfuricurvum sp. RIFCSPLOWO2_12_FULL_43_24]HBM36211.1 sensor domain-containing diguanyla
MIYRLVIFLSFYSLQVSASTPEVESGSLIYIMYIVSASVFAWMLFYIRTLNQRLKNESEALQKQIEISQNTEKYLRQIASVFHNSHEGIIITDPHMVILDVNEAYCDMSGYTHEKLIGTKPVILYSNRHAISFYAKMNESLEINGTWRGEVWDKKKSGEEYAKFLRIDSVHSQEGVIEGFVIIVSDITENKKEIEDLEHQANYDALTNLPNRSLFQNVAGQILAQSKRRNTKAIVAFLDLDGFKQINDQYGHTIGDSILKHVSRRLEKQMRQGDIIARLGGDEFVLLLSDINAISESRALLERILFAIKEPYVVNGFSLSIGASIGVAIFPDDKEDIELLIRDADIAMYHSKETGRNKISYFNVLRSPDAVEK